MAVWVDDFLFGYSDNSVFSNTVRQLTEMGYTLKLNGPIQNYLGVRFSRDWATRMDLETMIDFVGTFWPT